MKVKIKIVQNGQSPKYAHKNDACADCYARLKKPLKLKSGKMAKIPLGFCLELPKNTEAEIRPRSGLSVNGVFVILGTIDSNYRGEVNAIVTTNRQEFEINNGDRICQMSIRKTNKVNFVKVEKLNETERGIKGFGSSGV